MSFPVTVSTYHNGVRCPNPLCPKTTKTLLASDLLRNIFKIIKPVQRSVCCHQVLVSTMTVPRNRPAPPLPPVLNDRAYSGATLFLKNTCLQSNLNTTAPLSVLISTSQHSNVTFTTTQSLTKILNLCSMSIVPCSTSRQNRNLLQQEGMVLVPFIRLTKSGRWHC